MSLNLQDFSSYTITNIDSICYDSFPCQHDVFIKLKNSDNIIKVNMFANTIAEYYKYNNITIPQHYVMYFNNKN